MKSMLRLFTLAAVMSFGLVSWTHAAEEMAAPGSQTIKGDVLKIDGEYYVVKDSTGKEVRLHVDKTSKLEKDLKAGDKIEAQVTDKGHAQSIKRDSHQEKSMK